MGVVDGRAAVLTAGSTVGVVAPGFAVPREPIVAGLRRLRSMGFRVEAGAHLLSRDGYLAGTDDERALDLDRMFRDRRIDGIWFARGGYGVTRLLDRIDRRAVASRPRVLVGFSDLTALFAAIDGVPRVRCVLGPTVLDLAERSAFHGPSLRAALSGSGVAIPFARRQVIREGRARGRLVGGTLTLLSHLVGTPYLPSFAGRILLLEDVGEETYRIDRMLTHLRLAGAFHGLRAVALGRIDAAPRKRPFPPDRDLGEVLRETFLPLGVPIVADLPFGHRAGKRSLCLGADAVLDTDRRRFEVLPARTSGGSRRRSR